MDKKRFKKFKRKLKNLNICNLNFSIFKLKMMIIVQFLLKVFKKMWNKNLPFLKEMNKLIMKVFNVDFQ